MKVLESKCERACENHDGDLGDCKACELNNEIECLKRDIKVSIAITISVIIVMLYATGVINV